MKVQNMTSPRTGRPVANQFIVTDESNGIEWFQSYKSMIARKCDNNVQLDSYYWNYSVTTGKYRNQFLGETKAETQAKIDSGEYILTNLNKG